MNYNMADGACQEIGAELPNPNSQRLLESIERAYSKGKLIRFCLGLAR